nr:lipocalin-like domain-containing protein [Acidobacterium sp. S8]
MKATKKGATKVLHTTAADFIGTWKLIDYSFLHENGTVEKPWGDHVVGYLLYSAEGYMSGNLSPAGRRHKVDKTEGKKYKPEAGLHRLCRTLHGRGRHGDASCGSKSVPQLAGNGAAPLPHARRR